MIKISAQQADGMRIVVVGDVSEPVKIFNDGSYISPVNCAIARELKATTKRDILKMLAAPSLEA